MSRKPDDDSNDNNADDGADDYDFDNDCDNRTLRFGSVCRTG